MPPNLFLQPAVPLTRLRCWIWEPSWIWRPALCRLLVQLQKAPECKETAYVLSGSAGTFNCDKSIIGIIINFFFFFFCNRLIINWRMQSQNKAMCLFFPPVGCPNSAERTILSVVIQQKLHKQHPHLGFKIIIIKKNFFVNLFYQELLKWQI